MANQLLSTYYNPGSSQYYDDEVFSLAWLRAYAHVRYNRPVCWFTLGDIGSGKSSLQEEVGQAYVTAGSKLLDLQSAQDCEGLAWLRADCMEGKKILLLTGQRTRVKMSYTQYAQKCITNVTIDDIQNYDAIINVFAFYENAEEYFTLMKPFLEMLYQKRLYWDRSSANGVIFTIVREAANLMYSRTKTSESQKDAKAQLVYIIRESRHSGLSMSLDTLRSNSIEIDIRRPSAYVAVKALGFDSLPENLTWLYYNYVDPSWVQNMKPNEVLLLTKENSAIGAGTVNFPDFHKTEEENLLEILGLSPVTNFQEDNFKTKQKEMNPEKVKYHIKIIGMYYKEKKSQRQIQKDLGLGSLSPIQDVLYTHITKVGISSVCSICEAGNSELATAKIHRDNSESLKARNQLKREEAEELGDPDEQ